MFLRRIRVDRVDATGRAIACPVAQIDNFCMRNFTNDAAFDDTLPIADGLLETGNLVPLDGLRTSMEGWFRRKGYLTEQDTLRLTERVR